MPDRIKMIRAIKAAQRTLAIDDATYRAVLMDITGKDSCAKMTGQELEKTLAHFRRAGFRPADDSATRGQRGLIAAIWQEMAYDGVVRDASPRALEAYVRRICKGCQLADLSVTGCSHVIESLKRWVNRAGSMELRRKVFSELCSGATL